MRHGVEGTFDALLGHRKVLSIAIVLDAARAIKNKHHVHLLGTQDARVCIRPEHKSHNRSPRSKQNPDRETWYLPFFPI